MRLALVGILLASNPSSDYFLRSGIKEMKRHNYEGAVVLFEKARVEETNMVRRTMIYWNLFFTHSKIQGHGDLAVEELFGFMIYANDLIMFAKENDPKLYKYTQDIVLDLRLLESLCIIEHYWKHRDPNIFEGCLSDIR